MKRTAGLILSLLIAAALVLASCTSATTGPTAGQTVTGTTTQSSTTTTTTTPTTTTPTTTTTTPDVPEPVVDPSEPIYGGTLTISTATNPYNFDCAYQLWNSCSSTWAVASHLSEVDWWKGPAGSNEWNFDLPGVLPARTVAGAGLADSWEMPDTQTIILHLQEGVMFQSKPGVMSAREFTADDVVFNIERYTATQGNWMQTNTAGPETVTAIDRYTVEVKQKQVGYGFALYLPWYFPFIAPEQIEEYGDASDWRGATGTGPYMLTDFVPDSALRYERNDNWYKKDPEGRSLPYLDGVKVLVIPDKATRLSAMRTGQLDLITSITWQDAESLDTTNPELQGRGKLATSPIKLFLPHIGPPFGPTYDADAIKVRRALSMAIDFTGIIEGYYNGNGILMPTLMAPAYDTTGAFLYENLPPEAKEAYTYNPTRARELLAEAGYPDGFQTTILTSPDQADFLSLVKGWWDDVGIEVEIEIAEVGALWAVILGHTMDGPLATPWGFGGGGPGTYSSDDEGNPTLYNGGLVNCPKCDAWNKELDTAFDDDRRAELYLLGSMEALVNQFQIVLPAAIEFNYWQPWVGGYRGETSSGFYNWHQIWNFIWLDEDMKASMGR